MLDSWISLLKIRIWKKFEYKKLGINNDNEMSGINSIKVGNLSKNV